MVKRHHTLAHGLAGEHLVCADLLLAGHRPALAPQLCPFDILAEIDGRLWRIQVKTTECARSNDGRRQGTKVYQWSFRKRGKTLYSPKEVDLLALVSIDSRRIAYVLPDAARGCITIRANDDKYSGAGSFSRGYGQAGRTFSEYSLERAISGDATMAIKRPLEIETVRRAWTAEESQLVMSRSMPDALLSQQINRNVKALQNHRRKLKNKEWQKSFS